MVLVRGEWLFVGLGSFQCSGPRNKFNTPYTRILYKICRLPYLSIPAKISCPISLYFPSVQPPSIPPVRPPMTAPTIGVGEVGGGEGDDPEEIYEDTALPQSAE